MSLNLSLISYSISLVLCIFVARQSFLVWKKTNNELGRLFFFTILFVNFYIGSWFLASVFFTNSPEALTATYIISHVFMGIGVAYLARFIFLSRSKISNPKKFFYIVLVMFTSDVIANIFLPNQPIFNKDMGVIDWGVNKYVGIYHSFILFSVLLTATALFADKAIKNWEQKEVRTRSAFVVLAIVAGIAFTAFRHVIKGPFSSVVADVGFIITFILAIIGFSPTIKGDNEGGTLEK
jgi:hypothetical protein